MCNIENSYTNTTQIGNTKVNKIQSTIHSCMLQFSASFHGVYSRAQEHLTIQDIQKMYDDHIQNLRRMINKCGNKVYRQTGVE
jgi:hypothetical protein